MTPSTVKQNSRNLYEIKIEMTYKCNLKCLHCSSEGSLDQVESISYDDMVKILESAAEIGVKKISLSGGEPFLWSSISKLLANRKINDFKIRIYTSGTSTNFQDIVSKINHENINFVFSLFSANPNIHDKLTGSIGSHSKTIYSIKQTQQKYNTEIHFVPINVNYSELKPLAFLAKKLGINKVSVLRFVPQGRGSINRQFILNQEQNEILKKDIIELREAGFNIRTGSPFNFLFLNSQPQCTSGMNKLIIAPDLSIYPCDAFKQISLNEIVGNDEYSSLKFHSLQDCWEKSKYLNKIRSVLKSEYQEPCKSCDKLDYCRSGCLAQKVLLHNSLKNSQDPSCLLKKKKEQGVL